jgi:hypothetical protein
VIKKIILLVLVLMVLVPQVRAQGYIINPETDPYWCDSDLVKQWLTNHRQYANVINDIWQSSTAGEFDATKGAVLIEQYIFALYEFPRPGCAEEAMTFTFYIAMTYSQYLVCDTNSYGCEQLATGRILGLISAEESVFGALYTIAGLDMYDPSLTLLRPPDWDAKWKELLDGRELPQRSL